jgi:predicted phosphodiesterase
MTSQRIAVISDIHGNLPALQAVLAEVDRLGPFDTLVGGGDYVSGGAYPAESLALVRQRGLVGVRGNTDEWVVEAATEGAIPARDYPPEAAHGPEELPADQWVANHLDQSSVEFLAQLPLFWKHVGPSGQTLIFFHATPWSPHDTLEFDADDDLTTRVVEAAGGDVLLHGHIHHAYLREFDGVTLGCVGAVGSPLDGDERPCFAIVEDDGSGWTVRHVRVSYDREPYLQAMERSGMPNASAAAARVRAAKP